MRFDRMALDDTRKMLQLMLGCPKWDISDGMYGVDDLIGGGVAYLVTDAGEPLAVVCLEQVQHEKGRELVIRVARQLTMCGDVTERVLPEIERRFGFSCKFVTVYTRRAGLVRKLEKAGYAETATIMRKTL